jgi:hypothetical protein
MQRYPGSIRTHEVPGTGAAGFLPYRCFLVDSWILLVSFFALLYRSSIMVISKALECCSLCRIHHFLR